VFWIPSTIFCQITPIDFFEEVQFKIENQNYSTTKDTIIIQSDKHLRFEYENVHAVAEVKIFPSKLYFIRKLELLPSQDFELVDSIINVNDNYFRFKVKFRQLTKSEYLQFTFSVKSDILSNPYIHELKLLQTTKTNAYLNPKDNQLFIGEERRFKVETNRPNNINFSEQWSRNKNINYKFSKNKGEVWIHLLPTNIGKQKLDIPIRSIIPQYDRDTRQLVYDLPPLVFEFEVEKSKLIFLNTNQKEITLNEKNRSVGTEIELNYHTSLQLNRTYRLEQQEEVGGPLIAEIFTRNILANGRVLCWLRTYNYHRQSEGYLYIKDGDRPLFISNFNITPKTRIDEVKILSKKGNLSKGSAVFPGEQIEIRVRGEGLHKSKLTFNGLIEIKNDSLKKTENELFFLAKVPLDISKNEIEILDYGTPVRNSLMVKEFQIPHPLDFVRLAIEDEKDIVLSEVNQTIFIGKTIPDIIIAFDQDKIDTQKRLYGKQFLTIDVTISDQYNRLLDKKTISNIIICPAENSPRFNFYDSKNCRPNNINLNEYLRQKTFDLDGWSRIEIIVQHDRSKYSGQGFYKKAEIVLKRSSSFDLDVSFPAGLVTKKVGESGFGNLNGVSMAIIAQFSFFQPKRIAKPRPFKIGVGFLALNAFNFSENNTNRDVGIVLLGSVYPIPKKRRSKLSFPLYLGAGYFLSESKFFYLLGPGVRINI